MASFIKCAYIDLMISEDFSCLFPNISRTSIFSSSGLTSQ
jgi:hypothetical protein